LKRVYLGVFGSGLGHASRMTAVGRRLVEDGDMVQFASSGGAAAYLRQNGFDCVDVPLVDVVFTENGNFSATETMKVAPWLFLKILHQTGLEARNMVRFAPDVVVSDSALASLLASKLLGRKSVTILNQLKLVSSPKTPPFLAKLLTNGSISVWDEFWELSDRILLPDLPPPYTISETNLWGAGSIEARAEYIGFLVPPRNFAVDAQSAAIVAGPKKLMFWQVSGPEKTRAAFLPKVRRYAKALKDEYISVISAGDPLGSTAPQAIDGGFYYDWCPSKDALIDRCDGLIARAGHVTISDLILRAKACILVPIPAQSEQEGNAAKAERLGVAAKIDEPDLGVGSIQQAVAKLDGDETRRRLLELSGIARKYDAMGSIAEAIG
jgi:UDP-N-acetylglucosamine--N-acetylmuramyl-(pentapeptide) pyrophosphoryl-undecaprenol N-acetylglucosamine transferase